MTPGLATTNAYGIVKPDGSTITISRGVITSVATNSAASRVVTSGTTDSATIADDTIVWNSLTSLAKTETLPQCSSSAPIVGHRFWIKGAKGDEATNNITVQAVGGSTFDGNGSATISVPLGGYGFRCDAAGGNYDVLAYYSGNGVFGGGPTPCGALQADFSVTTGCNAVALPIFK